MELEDIEWMWERTLPELILRDLQDAKEYFRFNRRDAAEKKVEHALDKSRQMLNVDRYDEDDVSRVVSALHVLNKSLGRDDIEKDESEMVGDIRGLLIDFFRHEITPESANVEVKENPGWRRYDFKVDNNELKYKGEMNGWSYKPVTDREIFIALFDMMMYMSSKRVPELAEQFEAEGIPLDNVKAGLSKIIESLQDSGHSDAIRGALRNAWTGSDRSLEGHHWARIYNDRYSSVEVSNNEFVENYLPTVLSVNRNRTVKEDGKKYDVERDFRDDDFLEWLKTHGDFSLLDSDALLATQSVYMGEAEDVLIDNIMDFPDPQDTAAWDDYTWEDILTEIHQMVMAVIYGVGEKAEPKASLMDFIFDYVASDLVEHYEEFKKYDTSEPAAFTVESDAGIASLGLDADSKWYVESRNDGQVVLDWDTSEQQLFVVSETDDSEDYFLLEIFDREDGELVQTHRLDFIGAPYIRDNNREFLKNIAVTEDGKDMYMLFLDKDINVLALSRVSTMSGENVSFRMLSSAFGYLDLKQGVIWQPSLTQEADLLDVTELSGEKVGLSVFGRYDGQAQNLSDVEGNQELFHLVDDRSDESAEMKITGRMKLSKDEGYLGKMMFHEIIGDYVFAINCLKEDKSRYEIVAKQMTEDDRDTPIYRKTLGYEEDLRVENWYLSHDEYHKFYLASSFTIAGAPRVELDEIRLHSNGWGEARVIWTQKLEDLEYKVVTDSINRVGDKKVVHPRGLTVQDDVVFAALHDVDDFDEGKRNYNYIGVVNEDGMEMMYITGEECDRNNSVHYLSSPVISAHGGFQKVWTGDEDLPEGLKSNPRHNPEWKGYDWRLKDGELEYKGWYTMQEFEKVDVENVVPCLVDYLYYMNRTDVVEDLPEEFADSDIRPQDFINLLEKDLVLDGIDKAREYAWFGDHYYGRPFAEGVDKRTFTARYLARVIHDRHLTVGDYDNNWISFNRLIDKGFIEWLVETDCEYGFSDIDFSKDSAQDSPQYEPTSEHILYGQVGQVVDDYNLKDYKEEEGFWRDMLTLMNYATERLVKVWADYIYSQIDIQECVESFLMLEEPRIARDTDESVVYTYERTNDEVYCISQDDMNEIWRTSLPDAIDYLDGPDISHVMDMRVLGNFVFLVINRAPVKSGETEYEWEIIKINKYYGGVVEHDSVLRNDYRQFIGDYYNIDKGKEMLTFIAHDEEDDTLYVEYHDMGDLSHQFSFSLPEHIEDVGSPPGPRAFHWNEVVKFGKGHFFGEDYKENQVAAFIAKTEFDETETRTVVCYDLLAGEVVYQFSTSNDKPFALFPCKEHRDDRFGIAAVEYTQELKNVSVSKSTNRVEFFNLPDAPRSGSMDVDYNFEWAYEFENEPTSYYRQISDINLRGDSFTLESSIDVDDTSSAKGEPSDYNIRKRDGHGMTMWEIPNTASILEGRHARELELCRGTGNLFLRLHPEANKYGSADVPLVKIDSESGEILGTFKWSEFDKRFTMVISDA